MVVNGQVGSINTIDATLDPATGAYSFTMPAYDVTIEATIALKPVPEGDVFAGFTATAGSGGFDNEGHANLVDGKFTSGNVQTDWTKWCTNNDHRSVPTGESGDACWWIDFEASAALDLTGYILTTGNDTGNEHGRNPKNWVLKAKLNAGDAWTTIATVTNDVTMKNQSFKDYKFFVDQSGSYKYFRFEVFANQGANVMQLCELRLIGSEASDPTPAGNLKLIEFQVPASWENDNSPITIADFPDFVATTYEIASALPVTSEPSLVVFDFPGDDEMSVYTKLGGQVSEPSTGTIVREAFFDQQTQIHYYYPVLEGGEPEPTPTVWTALKVGDVIKLGDKIEVPAEGDGSWGINGNVLRNAWGPYTLIRADIYQASEFDDPVVTETEDGAFYVFKAENSDFYPLSYLGKSGGLVVTTTSDGIVVTAAENKEFTVAVHDKGDTPTGVENVQTNHVQATKFFRDGMLLIEKNGKIYNVQGVEVR